VKCLILILLIRKTFFRFAMNKKILITGATGLIGRKLCSELLEQGNEARE